MTRHSDDSRADDLLPSWYTSMSEKHSVFPMYEHIAEQGFPTVKQLRQGIVLGSIADALYLATGQESYGGHSWDGDTYLGDNQQGERWAASRTNPRSSSAAMKGPSREPPT